MQKNWFSLLFIRECGENQSNNKLKEQTNYKNESHSKKTD